MKLINLLTLIFAAFIFAGCASTNDPASAADNSENASANAAESQFNDSKGLLMDRYKSGAIPGYRD